MNKYFSYNEEQAEAKLEEWKSKLSQEDKVLYQEMQDVFKKLRDSSIPHILFYNFNRDLTSGTGMYWHTLSKKTENPEAARLMSWAWICHFSEMILRTLARFRFCRIVAQQKDTKEVFFDSNPPDNLIG